MIDPGAARQQVVEVLTLGGLDAAVYPLALDGVTDFPAVVLGMPSWSATAPGSTFCLDTITIPVAVVVARPGHDEAATVAALDALWPQVLALLDTEDITAVRADFGLFTIAGSDYPAQIITVQITT